MKILKCIYLLATMFFVSFHCSVSAQPSVSKIGIAATPFIAPHKRAPCKWEGYNCVEDGVFMDEIIRYKVKGVLLNVPAIYMSHWPSITQVGRLNDLDKESIGKYPGYSDVSPALYISFWMPRVRPDEMKSDAFIIPDLMKKQRKILQQGIEPAPDEYPVEVLNAAFLQPNDPDITLPDQRYKNRAETLSGSKDRFEHVFGLHRVFWEKEWASSEQYHNLPDSNIQFLASCSSDKEPAINPLCQANVYFNQEQLSFLVRFPKSKLSEWPSIVTAIRDLIVSWRQK